VPETQSSASLSNSRQLLKIAGRYGTPDFRRSALQLLCTILPLAGLWLTMALTVKNAYWLTLLLSLPASAFLVRLFMIQHDCGHRSFFRSRRLNDLLGHAIGMLTLTPHGYWRRAHNIHHATSGNLDQRGIGDLHVLTVREYQALPGWKRLAYRIYRNPIVLFGFGPIYIFVVKFRLPLDMLRLQRAALPSVIATNLVILAAFIGLGLWLGFTEALMVQGPIVAISSMAGVWLFYIQHQFERTYWRRTENWDYDKAAMQGSSFYDLPRILSWLTADIGIHHIHHLSSRIPNYRLRECFRENPALQDVDRISLRDGFRCVFLALWDESADRLVSFRSLALSQPST